MVGLDELRQQFARDMISGVRTLARLGYDASIFTRMLVDHDADEVARRLVLDRIPSYGLWRLKELGKLDMSVEMWVQLPWYEPLFHEDIREKAARKLDLLGVDVPTELDRLIRRLRPD
jgi:hypothetical protein